MRPTKPGRSRYCSAILPGWRCVAGPMWSGRPLSRHFAHPGFDLPRSARKRAPRRCRNSPVKEFDPFIPPAATRWSISPVLSAPSCPNSGWARTCLRNSVASRPVAKQSFKPFSNSVSHGGRRPRAGAHRHPRTPPPRETEFRPQVRSQTEFGNEDAVCAAFPSSRLGLLCHRAHRKNLTLNLSDSALMVSLAESLRPIPLCRSCPRESRSDR